MNYSRLEGGCKIVNKDGTDLTTQDVSIINLSPNTLFKSAQLSLNGIEVQDNSTSCYPYKVRLTLIIFSLKHSTKPISNFQAYLENLLCYGIDAKGMFTIYVYNLRWVVGLPNVNECKRGVGRWSELCKRLQKIYKKKPFQCNRELLPLQFYFELTCQLCTELHMIIRSGT